LHIYLLLTERVGQVRIISVAQDMKTRKTDLVTSNWNLDVRRQSTDVVLTLYKQLLDLTLRDVLGRSKPVCIFLFFIVSSNFI